MNADERRLNDITETISGCAYRVSNTLGSGFLEKVYENALAVEIKKAGIRAVQQARIEVTYESHVVGEYCADLLVEACVIVVCYDRDARKPSGLASLSIASVERLRAMRS